MQAAQAQQAQQLNSQLLLPQAMPMSMQQPNHLRSGQTKATLTYGEYKKLQQMQKDPNYREDAWNPDTHHLGDPRKLQQQKSVDSMASMASNNSLNPITKENWETHSGRDDEWERHQNRG